MSPECQGWQWSNWQLMLESDSLLLDTCKKGKALKLWNIKLPPTLKESADLQMRWLIWMLMITILIIWTISLSSKTHNITADQKWWFVALFATSFWPSVMLLYMHSCTYLGQQVTSALHSETGAKLVPNCKRKQFLHNFPLHWKMLWLLRNCYWLLGNYSYTIMTMKTVIS